MEFTEIGPGRLPDMEAFDQQHRHLSVKPLERNELLLPGHPAGQDDLIPPFEPLLVNHALKEGIEAMAFARRRPAWTLRGPFREWEPLGEELEAPAGRLRADESSRDPNAPAALGSNGA